MVISFPKQSNRKEYSYPIESPTHLVTPYLHTTSSGHSPPFYFFSLFPTLCSTNSHITICSSSKSTSHYLPHGTSSSPSTKCGHCIELIAFNTISHISSNPSISPPTCPQTLPSFLSFLPYSISDSTKPRLFAAYGKQYLWFPPS